MIMLAAPEISVNRFFERPDKEKQFLYKLMLEEKQIYFEVTGEATIKTKRDQIEMLIENLISNAVKYTPEQGNISVLVTPKSITVKNSVSEKLRTRKLKQPFVRGDKARSNVKGIDQWMFSTDTRHLYRTIFSARAGRRCAACRMRPEKPFSALTTMSF